MPKVIITDPAGVRRGGVLLKQNEEHEIPTGPHLEAWLRFKQVKEVKPVEAKKPGGEQPPKK